MPIQLFGDPFNLQGNNQPLQGGFNPQQTANPQQPAPVAAPRPRIAAPKPVQPTATFYRPDPNSQQVYNAQGQPVSYEQYLAQGGLPNWSNVLHQPLPGQQVQQASQTPKLPTSQPLQGPPAPQIQPQDAYQQFAQSAAQAGLGVEDYLKYITSGVSTDERNNINKGLGIPDLYKQLFTPAPKTQDLYNQAYSQAGLKELKAKISAKLAEVNKIQSLYTEKGGKINENPFLSEASRVGRLRVLDDKRLQEIGNLSNQLQSMEDLYNNGVNEVNSVVSRSTADFSNDQQINSLKLTYLQQQAEQQLADLQGTKSAEAYKYLPDFLKAKAAAAKPDTIGSNETGYYRWNPATSTFEQVIAPQVTPNYQANPLTGELFNTKDGSSIGSGNTIAGLAQAILQNPAAYSQLTTAQQGAVNNYFAQSGQPIPTQLTPEQKNKIASIGVLQQTISAIESLGTQLGWAGVGGACKGSIQQFLAKNFGKGSQQEQMLRSFIGNLQATIAKERGGTSFTANEQALLEQYAPTINDSPLVIQSKLQALKQYFGSSIPSGSQGNNPSDPLGLFSSAGNASASTPYLKTLGPVTGENGSSLWSYGLDVDLKKGDPVRSPVSGKVIAAAPNGGFGNQVKIRTADGQEIWLSHLQSGSVKVGQTVSAGQVIGIGGNTGKTIALQGGDGSHLDITMKDSSGKLLSAPQVKRFLDKIYV